MITPKDVQYTTFDDSGSRKNIGNQRETHTEN